MVGELAAANSLIKAAWVRLKLIGILLPHGIGDARVKVDN
jgi:hypothetical protein